MKHASFFSGVGGLDLGFEKAGIETVSVSEIDPYACTVLAERFPGAQNLGNITEINANDIPEADIWSGGFPCQDLSVAGKRAGFAGKRSSLAFTFLDLVEQRRPRWLVLENVPGLLSSNNGADFGRLLYEMEQLRYGVSWRTLDARYFGVPQRRRRVFIVGSLESDRSGEVLFECEGCERHPSPRKSSWQGAATSASDGSGIIGTVIAGLAHRTGTTQDQLYVGYGGRVANALTGRFYKGVNSTIDEPLIVSPSPDSDGVRAVDGMARRLDDQQFVARKSSFGHYEMTEQAGTLKSSGGDIGGGSENIVGVYQTRVDEKNGTFSLNETNVVNSLSALWPADTSHRSMTLISFPSRYSMQPTKFNDQTDPLTVNAGAPAVVMDHMLGTQSDYDLLPAGLDSHRYRCCGNGVVANVAEWIGHRIVAAEGGK